MDSEGALSPFLPRVDPDTFDLIVVGTGLPASIIAGAASTVGKSVIHLDANSFYGSNFSSLSIQEFTSFLNAPVDFQNTDSITTTETDECLVVKLARRSMYSNVDVTTFLSESVDSLEHRISIDLSGPRILYCADKTVDLMQKSGASLYVEFKNIEASFVGNAYGGLWMVPDCREAIFKDKSLNLLEKNTLMRFLKMVQRHLLAASGEIDREDEEHEKFSAEDMERPFVEFLAKIKLSPKIISIILYAIGMEDYCQDNLEDSSHILKTRDGISRLLLHQSSINRLTGAPNPFIFPIYGHGELSQAFCRRSAVKGCIYVLRMPVTALLVNKSDCSYKGVQLASDQKIFSKHLVMEPVFAVPEMPHLELLHEKFCSLSLSDNGEKVARGIAITGSSLKPDSSNILITYPPKSFSEEQKNTIRVLQVGSTTAVCPVDMYVLYFSTYCHDPIQGKKLIDAAMHTILKFPFLANQTSASFHQDSESDARPFALWCSTFVQDIPEFQGHHGSISFTPAPDGKLNYDDILDAVVQIFQWMYPNDELFPSDNQESSEDH